MREFARRGRVGDDRLLPTSTRPPRAPQRQRRLDEAAFRPRLEPHDFHGDWNYTLRPPKPTRV